MHKIIQPSQQIHKNIIQNHSTHYTDSSFPILFHNNHKKINLYQITQPQLKSSSEYSHKTNQQKKQSIHSNNNISINSEKPKQQLKQYHQFHKFYQQDGQQIKKYIGRAQNLLKWQSGNINKQKKPFSISQSYQPKLKLNGKITKKLLQEEQIPKIQRIRQIYTKNKVPKRINKTIELKAKKSMIQQIEPMNSNLRKITQNQHQEEILKKNKNLLKTNMTFYDKKTQNKKLFPSQQNPKILNNIPKISSKRYSQIQDQFQSLPLLPNIPKSQKQTNVSNQTIVTENYTTQKATIQSQLIQKRIKQLENQYSRQNQIHIQNNLSNQKLVSQIPSVRKIAFDTSSKTNDMKSQFSTQMISTSQSRIQQFIRCFKPHTDIFKNIDISTFIIKKYKNGVYFGQVLHIENQQQNTVKHGYGAIFYYNGRSYEGKFQNDLKSGRGFQLYPDGSFYEGCYQLGMKSGKGRFVWANGQIYDGQWQKGKKHGSGMWKNASDQAFESYIGEWYQGKVQGFGVYTNSKGDRYQGEFKNSLKHGLGTQRFGNGEVYVGAYEKGRKNGYGQFYFKNGDIYKGQFCNDTKHGKGVYKKANGINVYEGEYRNDKKCGKGKFIGQNQEIYIGNFQNDFKHGYGEMTTLYDNKIIKGYWINDELMNENSDKLASQNYKKIVNNRIISRQSNDNKQKKSLGTKFKFYRQKLKRFSKVNQKSLQLREKSQKQKSLKQKSPTVPHQHNYQRNCGCNKVHNWR